MNNQNMMKLSSIALVTMTVGLTGCQTVKGWMGNDTSDVVESAENSAAGYYNEAVQEIENRNYNIAADKLNSVRTFYPTSPYAQQALLDLMYVKFTKGEYVEAVSSAEEFIRLYPSNPQLDYAYYVRGVANMQSTTDKLNLFKLDQAKRDTSAYRLGFSTLQEFIVKFPNSQYAPDAAQRMTYIYNSLAESEMQVARWYIKREAYLAAAKRANWVFQYFPQSESVPEAIATLAYSNEQLGLTDLANQYKTLLQINYPEYLSSNGEVKIDNGKRSFLNRLTFGALGRASDDGSNYSGSYNGQTRTQVIQNAQQLRLPASN